MARLDMQLPDVDGLQVAAAIARDATLAGLPVIVLSSAGMARAAGPHPGVNVSLMRPVRQAELYTALVQMLGPASEPLTPADPGRSLPARAPGWRGRLLVVEDNVINQTVAGEIDALERWLTEPVALPEPADHGPPP